jgi:hypothetical protein
MPALPPGGDSNALPSPRKRPTSSGPLRALGSLLAVAHSSVPRRAPTQSRTFRDARVPGCLALRCERSGVSEARGRQARADVGDLGPGICKLYG